MKPLSRRAARLAVGAGLVALALLGLNHLMTFPLSSRAGDPAGWFGRGPAGGPVRRAYALAGMKPTERQAPRSAEALARLAESEMAESRSAYPVSASAGSMEYWESNRRVLIAPPPSTYSYQLTVPAGAYLDFGFALTRYPKRQKGDRRRPQTTFVIEWQDRDGTRELFRETVRHRDPGWWEANKERRKFYRLYLRARLERTDDMFQDRRLDLAGLAGRTGTLRFVTTTADGPDHCLPALWAGPEIWAPDSAPPPTNVVIFMIEATPARMVAPHEGNPGVTPHLAAFAREAAVFDRFFVVGDSTKLSTPSFFTGRHYQSMGLPVDVHHLAPVVKDRFYRRRLTSLAEAFGRAGYATVQFGTNHYVQPTRDFGLDLGFDRIDILGRRYYAHADTMLAALGWLRENGAKPFLLYLHHDAPHQEDKPCLEDLLRSLSFRTGDGRWQFRKYLAQVARADRDFGILLKALSELGVRGRTLVVVTSDHGNCLNPDRSFAVLVPGEGPWRTPFIHGRAMGFEDINPPLMVDWPVGPAGASRSSAPLMSIDLFPTLVQLLLPNPDPDTVARMADLEGKSFAALLDPALGPQTAGREVTYTLSRGGEMIVSGGRHFYCRRQPDFSRLLFDGEDRMRIVRERLIDIVSDPLETRDLAGQEPALLAAMRQALRDHRPAEAVLSMLYLNFPGGTVEVALGLKGGGAEALTFPEGRPEFRWRELGPGPVIGFEAELDGPTGIALDGAVEWVWVRRAGRELAAPELRLGRFGLPLLAAAGPGPAVALPDGRELRPVRVDGLDPAVLDAPAHPTAFSSAEGVYLYRMTFTDLISRDFNDRALSAGVRSILHEWGYIQ